MRRLFLNIFVSVLTLAIGISTSALLKFFTPSSADRGSACITAALPLKTADRPTSIAWSSVDGTSASDVISSPFKAEISGGVLNGKAISLPKPNYPPVAKAARQSGTVTVQVIVDEYGQVILARAVGGPPLLLAAAVNAAYGAKFSPTKLSGRPVKVSGIITYNFVLQ